jgi:cell division septation protein DedD
MANPDSSPAPEITLLDRTVESPTDLLYRAAVGPISADYYLPLLARFEQAGRVQLSWNWAACLYTLNWMAFRSLWVAALAYVGIMLFVPLLVFGIGRLVLQLSETTEMVLLVTWGALSFVVPGAVGNAVLRSDLRQRMTRAITDSKTLVQACNLLAAQASSRQRLIGLGVVNLILLGGALGFYLALPEDGPLARVRPSQTLERIAEAGPVIDLTAQPAMALASAAAPAASSASEPTPFAAAAAASTPPPVEPASAPIAALPVLAAPASTPLVAPPPPPTLPPQPLPVAVVQPRRAGPASAEPKAPAPYFINVGLFSKEANARNAQATLKDAGLKPTAQEIGTGQGKRIRLRAGPFDTRAQADAAAEKIRSLKLEAQVFQP